MSDQDFLRSRVSRNLAGTKARQTIYVGGRLASSQLQSIVEESKDESHDDATETQRLDQNYDLIGISNESNEFHLKLKDALMRYKQVSEG